MNETKILTLDIENMANLLWSWQTRSFNGSWSSISVEQPWYPIGVGVKWFGEEGKYLALEDYRGYKPLIRRYKDGSFKITPPNLKPLLKDVWDYLNEADIVIGWNSDSFDIKKLNDYFVRYGFPPYAPIQSVDVMKKKRQVVSSDSNKLDDTGEQWGTGRKTQHDGWDLWVKCAEGDKKSLKHMAEYCIQDLQLTEDNYVYLRGWMKTHPAMNVFSGRPESCPRCGATGSMQKGMKYRATSANLYQYYRCKECSGMAKSRVPEPKSASPDFT